MSSIRKRQALTNYQRATKRRRTTTRYGLVPIYRGFTPRAFSRGEWKYVDTSLSQDFNVTPSMTLLNGLAPGTSASTRIGMKVDFRSIEMKGRLLTTPGTGVEQVIRAMIVLDRQPNGVAPTAITDILVGASTITPRNLANRKRFKILWDKILPMGATSVSTGTPTSRVLKLYKKFKKPITTEYNTGVAGTIADISTNSLYFITYGSVAAGDTDVNGSLYFRLRFSDV